MKADFLICGCGIVGLTLARELLKRGNYEIILIDKEPEPGKHASGRNSGVLHAGIYYAKDSTRAKTCLEGNRLMREYCRQRGLPLGEYGKVIVAKEPSEVPILQGLYERGLANGAKLSLVDEKELEKIEPWAKTCGQAIYSPETAVVNPKLILQSLLEELLATGRVRALFNTSFLGPKSEGVLKTTAGEISAGLFINAAGAHGDKIAHSFGLAGNYRLVPFKGIYRKLAPDKAHLIKGSVYPVPDMRNPFLGVHFTRGISGDVYLGPTAIPAFGRENYGILSGLDSEALTIILRDLALFLRNGKFREVALTEPRKYFSEYFYNDAKKLVKDLKREDVLPCAKAGIRPQLIDVEKAELIMDFMILREGKSLHVLNAISPAFTSSLAFAGILADACL